MYYTGRFLSAGKLNGLVLLYKIDEIYKKDDPYIEAMGNLFDFKDNMPIKHLIFNDKV